MRFMSIYERKADLREGYWNPKETSGGNHAFLRELGVFFSFNFACCEYL